MKTMTKLMRIMLATLSLSVVLLASIPAFANPGEQIEQFRAMLDEQDALDTKNAAAKDREMARKWLNEAEVLVANGREEAASRRLRRVEFAVELVTALVAAAIIRQKAEEQEAAAYAAPEARAKLEAAVEELRKQKAELTAELAKLKQYQQ